MSEETPKLYTNKPKKAQLKQSIATAASSSPASAAAASYKMGSQSTAPPPPPPPTPPQKESFARRYKFLWPLFLTVNLAVGVYVFMRTTKKETGLDEEKPTNGSSTQVLSTAISTSPVTEKLISSPAILEPEKPREPIPEHQQRELFKWILEEKRKVKPKDPEEEKKRIDEEKAILKEFIRAKTIPKI